MKVAVIGTGISGMVSAFLLKKNGHDVTVFEKNNYVGGHTHTLEVPLDGKTIAVDSGFIVFNAPNYFYLNKLFKHLDVPIYDTDMSFSVSFKDIDFEYCGSTLNTLFAQRSNVISPKFYQLIYQIHVFNRTAEEVLYNEAYQKLTITEYFAQRNLGDLCLNYYLLPMAIALWSAPRKTIEQFPIWGLVRFLKNHGLLGFTTQYPWKTVKGGSSVYKTRLTASFKENIQIDAQVTKVEREKAGVNVHIENQGTYRFDKVVMAGHADQSLAILSNPSSREANLLAQFTYQANRIDMHTDDSVMPKRRKAWAAWNHVVENENTFVSYWMNKLQPLDCQTNCFVSLNASDKIHPKKILRTLQYEHPVFTNAALIAQKDLPFLNTVSGNIFYCGSYFGNGFHEAGIESAVKMCETILGQKELL